jgi:hypothetical protein
MTTRKPYQKAQGSVTFGEPTIGPRVYLVRGPSGWPETFQRESADQALTDFLSPLDRTSVIHAFSTTLRVEHRTQMTWETVAAYLAKVTNCPGQIVPEAATVAFWGLWLLYNMNEGTN